MQKNERCAGYLYKTRMAELNEAYNKMKGIRNKPDFIEVYQRVSDIVCGFEFQKEKAN